LVLDLHIDYSPEICSTSSNIEMLPSEPVLTIIIGYSGDNANDHSEVITVKATFDIFEKEGVLFISIKGDPTVSEIKRVLEQMRDESGYRNLSRLWDFRKAAFHFSVKELEEIASHASSADLDPARVAMLVSQDLSYGVSRMYEAYRKSPLTDVKVFRDEAEAIEWLTD